MYEHKIRMKRLSDGSTIAIGMTSCNFVVHRNFVIVTKVEVKYWRKFNTEHLKCCIVESIRNNL